MAVGFKTRNCSLAAGLTRGPGIGSLAYPTAKKVRMKRHRDRGLRTSRSLFARSTRPRAPDQESANCQNGIHSNLQVPTTTHSKNATKSRDLYTCKKGCKWLDSLSIVLYCGKVPPGNAEAFTLGTVWSKWQLWFWDSELILWRFMEASSWLDSHQFSSSWSSSPVLFGLSVLAFFAGKSLFKIKALSSEKEFSIWVSWRLMARSRVASKCLDNVSTCVLTCPWTSVNFSVTSFLNWERLSSAVSRRLFMSLTVDLNSLILASCSLNLSSIGPSRALEAEAWVFAFAGANGVDPVFRM